MLLFVESMSNRKANYTLDPYPVENNDCYLFIYLNLLTIQVRYQCYMNNIIQVKPLKFSVKFSTCKHIELQFQIELEKTNLKIKGRI